MGSWWVQGLEPGKACLFLLIPRSWSMVVDELRIILDQDVGYEEALIYVGLT